MRTIIVLLLTVFAIHLFGQDIISSNASKDKSPNKVETINMSNSQKGNPSNQSKLTSNKNKNQANTSEKRVQRTLVTKEMATKITGVLLHGNANAFEHKIFMISNNVQSLITEARLLKDVYNHLDCIENFIIGIYDWSGKTQAFSYFHKTFFLNWDECKITEQIYDNWIDARKNEEIEKKKLEQQDEQNKELELYSKWTSSGNIPAFSENKVSEKAILSAKTVDIFKDKLLKGNDTFFYQRFLPTSDFETKKPRRNIKSEIIFNIIIDKDNNISLQDETYKFSDDYGYTFSQTEQHNYQDLFESLGLAVVVPAKYTFKELNKTIDVPSKSKVIVQLTATRNDEFKCVIGNYNKKEKQWDFGNNEFEMYKEGSEWWTVGKAYHEKHYTRGKKVDGKGTMTDDEISQLRCICSLKEWAEDSKKRVLSYVNYDVSIKVIGVEESISISIPGKVGFSGSFEK